jgi:hypothetical protein
MRRYRNFQLSGVIRSRLLVNAVVDPGEAARRLPAGLQPHVGPDGTVVGCCLLDIAQARPNGLSVPGVRIRAAAHRIAVTWRDKDGDEIVGVWVPARLTDSRVARLAGGRVFPGVHRPASIHKTDDGERIAWHVAPASPVDFAVRVTAVAASAEAEQCEGVGNTCLSALVGLSPGHDGHLEAARMAPSHRRAQLVEMEVLDSAFLASFASACPASSYLMRDVGVAWSIDRAPALDLVDAR